MTLSLITNIIAATIAFVAIVGPLTWAIMTSRDAQASEATMPSPSAGRSHRRRQAGSPHFA